MATVEHHRQTQRRLLRLLRGRTAPPILSLFVAILSLLAKHKVQIPTQCYRDWNI